MFKYGWKDARDIELMGGGGRLPIFFDILRGFWKYYISGFQYKKNHLWELSGEEKSIICKQLGLENRFKDEWLNILMP